MSKEQKKESLLRFGQIIRIHGHRCLADSNDQRGMIIAKGFTDPDAKYVTFDTFRNCKFYRQSLFEILPKGSFPQGSSAEKLREEEKKKIQSDYQLLIQERRGKEIKFGEDVVFKHVDSRQYLSGSVSCSEGGLGAFKVELSSQLLTNLVFRFQPFRSFEKQGDNIKIQSPLRIKNMENRCFISTETSEAENNESEEDEIRKIRFDNKQQRSQKYSIVTTYSKNYTWLLHLHLQPEQMDKIEEIQTHDIIFLIYTRDEGYLCLEKNNDGDDFKAMVKRPIEDTGYHCYTCLWEIEKQPIPEISPPAPDGKKDLGVEGTYTLRDLLTGQYLKVFPTQKRSHPRVPLPKGGGKLNDSDPKQITIKSAKGMTNVSDFVKHHGLVKISGPKLADKYFFGEIDVSPEKNQSQQPRFMSQQPYEHRQVTFLNRDGEHGFRISKIDQQSKSQVMFILSTYEVLDQFSKELEIATSRYESLFKAKRFKFIDKLLIKLVAFLKECDSEDIENDKLPNAKRQCIAKDLKICDKLFSILKKMGQKILEQIFKGTQKQNESFKVVFNRAYYLILQIIKNNPITKLYVSEGWLEIILSHAIENEEDTVHETLNEILQSNFKVVDKFLVGVEKNGEKNKLIHQIINVFRLKPPHEKFLNIFRASCISDGFPVVTNQQPILKDFFHSLQDESKFFFVKLSSEGAGMSFDVQPDPKKLYLKCCISKDRLKVRTLKEFFDESFKLDLSQTSNYFISYLNLLADICCGRNTESKEYVQKILAPEIDDPNYFNDGENKYDALYTLNYILQDKEIQGVKGYKNLLRAVLRLINYAFVESADQNPILIIKRYRNIDEMAKHDENQKSSKFLKLQKVMNFVQEKLQEFKSFYDDDDNQQLKNREEKQGGKEEGGNKMSGKEGKQKKESEKLKMKLLKKQHDLRSIEEKEFLLTQLIILKSTLMIGYWSVSEQQKLLKLLLRVLSNEKHDILHKRSPAELTQNDVKQEIEKFKLEGQKHTPTVELITKCKALACELINIIFDFRHDKLVTMCVSVYKQLIDVQEPGVGGDKSIIIDENLNFDHRNQDQEAEIYDSDKWITKFKGIFSEKSDQNNEDDKDSDKSNKLIPLMVQLSIHRNPTLFYRSLSILRRFFQYRMEILNLFLNLSIYEYISGEYIAHEIAVKRIDLNALDEENKLFTPSTDGSNFYSKILSFLTWLSEAIKTKEEDIERIKANYKNFHNIFDHFDERQHINHFHQRVIKNMDIHPSLLKFIGLSQQPLKKFTPEAMLAIKYVYRFLSLLTKGFPQAQSEMIKIIPKIKKHIKQQIEMVQTGFESDEHKTIEGSKARDDCQAIEFLYELFSNNKALLFNEQEIEETCDLICTYVEEIRQINYYKSHLLDFLRSLIYFKDKQIFFNQSRILAKLQDSKKIHIFYRTLHHTDPNSDRLRDHIIQLVRTFERKNPLLYQIEQPGIDPPIVDALFIGPELTYFITLFNLFANLVEGRHTVNIGKCQQVHSYEMLMAILSEARLCFPLKATVRNYINQLYYSTSIDEDLYAQIIRLDIPRIIEDLNTILVILKKNNTVTYQLSHPIRYRYYDTYFFLYIQQIFLSLNYLFCDSQLFNKELILELNKNFSRGYYLQHYFVIRIYQRMRWLTEFYYQHKYMRGLLNTVTNKFKACYLDKFKINALRIFSPEEKGKHEPQNYHATEVQEKENLQQNVEKQLKKRCTMYIHRLVKGEISDFFIEKRDDNQKDKNFPLTFLLPYQEKLEDEDEKQINRKKKEMEHLAQKLRIMLFNGQKKRDKVDHHLILQTISDSLWSKTKFKNFIQSYMSNNCIQLFSIDENSKSHYEFHCPFVPFSEYINIFVRVNTEQPQSIPNQLRIFFFQTIYIYITQERTDRIMRDNSLDEQKKQLLIAKKIQKWKKQDTLQIEVQIQKRQQFLVEANVAELVIQSLKIATDNELFSWILKFGIAFLLGGYRNSQDALYQRLLLDEKNDVFVTLEKLITRLGRKIAGRIAERTNRVAPPDDQFIAQSLDVYDFFDPSIQGMKKFHNLSVDKNDENEQELEKEVFCITFRFLQLLCQCNHIDLKNFIREQINQDKQKKNYSFNFINVATFQIRRLFKVMNLQSSQIILPLINFLNEVVTIPCLQNQRSLCETTFFQDLCYMASFFEEQSNIKARSFEQEHNLVKLKIIYKHCILIILNVLQCGLPSIFKELLIKVKARFLLGRIRQSFKTLNIKSKKDLSNLLENQYPTEEKVPQLIEDAMNVMIVIEKLKECEGSEKFREEREAYIAEANTGQEKINLEALTKILRDQMLKIEVVSTSSQKRQFVYFPNHPILKTLSPTTRDRIMLEVSRTTQRQKIRSLFNLKDEIIKEIQFNFEIEKEHLLGVIRYKPEKIQKLISYAFTLSFIINIFWFMTSDIIIQYYQVIYHLQNEYRFILTLLDGTQLILTTLYFIAYYRLKKTLSLFRAQKEQEGGEQEQTEKSEQKLQDSTIMSKIKSVAQMPFTIVLTIISTLISFLMNTSIGILFRFDGKFPYVFAYLLFSLLGTFYDQTFFLTYIIFYFMENDTLSSVFNAITYNISKLISVGSLGMVFVYVFSLIFFNTYSLDMMSEKGDDACDNILSCILDLFVAGKINSGLENFEMIRFTTDLIWFAFFDLLFGNIVSGIMIQTFAELRSQREIMDDDKKNRCYICGKDRGILEKNDQKFEKHISEKHFLWNYIYYAYCLENKHETDRSGLEYEINDCIISESQEEKIKWIPFNTESGEEYVSKIMTLQQKMVKLNDFTKGKILAIQKAQRGGEMQPEEQEEEGGEDVEQLQNN